MIYLEGIHLKSKNRVALHKLAREVGICKSYWNTDGYYEVINPHLIERLLIRGITYVKVYKVPQKKIRQEGGRDRAERDFILKAKEL